MCELTPRADACPNCGEVCGRDGWPGCMEVALRLDAYIAAIAESVPRTDAEWVDAVNLAVNLASALGLRAMPRLRRAAGWPPLQSPPEILGHEIAMLMEVDR